ncbi:GNAT family N-acetyltransferase [Actinoplanes sp. NEAU-A12]|uniref:GNAT family N-acetyltransferase n=1 Tax=Actinoplanes sandaracinus TaxID=3045177 RepID=A0ABT6WC66_9ACTN|nr:GNAT family N-acetyltransferase [Actinoplanes sandaracinus]MDI6097327.1 GNAT family N-acetyltransferase [Actinoplanes sandaracinus]
MIFRVTALVNPDNDSPAWIAEGGDGRPLGTAFLRVPPTGGTADLRISVHPAERRAGVGTRLLREAIDAGTRRGLTALLGEPVREGSDGDAFCAAAGLRRVLALTYTRLDLSLTPSPHEAVSGYRLVHWEGTVPDEWAETYARSRVAMDDMPMDDAAFEPDVWDVARLHWVAEAVAARGEILLTTAAIAADGEIAGFTEVVVAGAGTGDGQHYGTGVMPEHRGRGLARWMKAEQIAHVRARFPELAGLLADTADSNAAMRRVNEGLGYRPTHRSLLYQADLA